MTDITLKYDVLEAIAKRSDTIGKQANEYANRLTGQVANAICNVAGQPSAYLDDASFFVNQKIKQLEKKSQEFYNFADQVTILSETANRIDEEVKNLLAQNQMTFLKHHESLRINGWKADLLNLLIDSKNKVPLLELIGKILRVSNASKESMKSSLKYWYNCEGEKLGNKPAGTDFAAASAVTFLALLSTDRNKKIVSTSIGDGIAASRTYTAKGTGKTHMPGEWVAGFDESLLENYKPADDLEGMDNFETQLAKFPESYQPMLKELHKSHPNWIFEPNNTGIDFNSFVDAEMKYGKPCSAVEAYQAQPLVFQDKGGFYKATESATSYFIDPRNFIDETNIFQLMSGEYNEKSQNIDAVKKVLENTPLKEYAQAFLDAGNKYHVSAVFLAAKALIETGGGKSNLAKGTVDGYKGSYNFYGVGASDGTNSSKNGAKYAKENGWDNPYDAIVGGASVVKTKYIDKGQDSLYSLKWDCNGYLDNGKPCHQWATNIADASSKAKAFARPLKDLDVPYVFKIPVYDNMPKSPAQP